MAKFKARRVYCFEVFYCCGLVEIIVSENLEAIAEIIRSEWSYIAEIREGLAVAD